MNRHAWIFGYGSLMWAPGFEVERREPGLLRGYHRRLCLTSEGRWGTPEVPGLVMGLLPGGSCRGVLLGVPHEALGDAIAYLDRREGPGYRRTTLRVQAPTEGVVAHGFVADPRHASFAGGLSVGEAAAIVRVARGSAGSSLEYLANTVAQLEIMGFRDRGLGRVLAAVRGASHENWSNDRNL